MLTDLLEDSNCKLKKTRLLNSSAAEEVCDSLTKVLGINSLLLSDLDLSGKIQGNSEMKKVSDLLEDSHCRTQKLKLNKCSITEEGCAALSSALSSNPSHLIELDLSENQLGDSGVKKICSLLSNQGCKLMKVGLSFCSITEEGYAALASALKSNRSSHLKELDLSGNDPGDTGVQKLINLLDDPNSNLKKLRFLKAPAAEEMCDSLTKVVGTNPLLLRELDLSGKTQGVSELQQLCSLLEDAHCKIEKLGLSNCSLTLESCAVLAGILSLDSSRVRKMDLSNNNLQDSGMQHLTGGLTNANCKLEIMMLQTCALTKESCSALTDVLNSKYSHMNELDLSNNNLEDSGVLQLSAGLKNPHSSLKIIRLSNSSITEDGCGALASALKSNPSHLMDLDLSENIIENSGVKQLCDLLMNSNCMLQKLDLSFCSITEEGYAALASALKSNPLSHLIELDLRGNDPGDTGVKKLTDLLEDPNCKLKTLRLLKSFAAEEACGFLTKALGTNPLLLRELDLSGKTQGVNKICDVLEDSHCKTRKLKLNKCSITEEGCAALSSALCSNPSHLIELDLSENQLGNSGVNKICSLLNNQCCELQKLNLSFCSITEEGYAALGSALKSKPSSHLIELDLRGNDPGDTGVKELTDIFMNSKKTLRLLNSDDAEEAWKRLNEILGRNPLLQRELDLSMKVPNDIQVKQLCALLQDPHYRLEKLKLSKSGSVKGDHCADLVSALIVNPSHLRELDLNENKLNKSGVEKLCILLKNPDCKLEKLKIKKGSIEEEGCAALASALTSNPSYLRELDLYKNKLGKSGVENLCNLLKNPHCKLENLKLVESLPDKSCAALVSALCGNPSYIRDLNLNKNKLDESGVENLCNLLKNPHCKLEKLKLVEILPDKSCAALVSALCGNPSYIRDLNLNKNKLDESGLKELCNLLKNPHCKLEKLKLANTMTDKSCAALVSALCENPSYIRNLDLTDNKLGDSGMKKLCDLLKNQDCKLQKLLIKNCSIGDKDYAALASAVSSHHLQLKLLDLRGNKLGESVMKQLSEIMMKSQCSLQLDAPKGWLSWLPSFNWNEVETEESSEDEEAHHMTAEVHTEVDRDKQITEESSEDQNKIDRDDQKTEKRSDGPNKMDEKKMENSSDKKHDKTTKENLDSPSKTD
uniref:Uncharacterized protein n=1 Tax=Pygocentrus nattereri TaxID=42514 RepID=A0AAR2IXM4_PYGNA